MKYIIYLLLLAIGTSCKPTHDFNHFRTKKLDPECEAFWTGFTKYLKRGKNGFLSIERLPKDSMGKLDIKTYVELPLLQQKEKGYNCFNGMTSQDIKIMLGEANTITQGLFTYYVDHGEKTPPCPDADFKMTKETQRRPTTFHWDPYGSCHILIIIFDDKDNVSAIDYFY